MSNRYKYTRKLIGLIDQFPVYYKAFKEKYQHRMLIFLFFMVLSSIFWFIRALNEQYEAEITYPIKYTKFPPNKMLVGKLPDKLTLKVQATGINIFAHKFPLKIKALKFNIESFSLQESGNNSFYILTKQIKEYVSEDLENMKILNIYPDTLFFRFTNVVTRKIAVKADFQNFDYMLAKQYTLNGKISSIPDSIIATGPQLVLDTLKCVYTEPISLKNLTDTALKSYNLKKIDQLEFNKRKVKILIPVDKFTETSMTSTIYTINVPDTLNLKTFPNTAKVTYRVSLSNYDRVNTNMIQPFVDYTFIGKSISSMLKVQLIDTPQFIYDIRIDPGSVEYLIERND